MFFDLLRLANVGENMELLAGIHHHNNNTNTTTTTNLNLNLNLNQQHQQPQSKQANVVAANRRLQRKSGPMQQQHQASSQTIHQCKPLDLSISRRDQPIESHTTKQFSRHPSLQILCPTSGALSPDCRRQDRLNLEAFSHSVQQQQHHQQQQMPIKLISSSSSPSSSYSNSAISVSCSASVSSSASASPSDTHTNVRCNRRPNDLSPPVSISSSDGSHHGRKRPNGPDTTITASNQSGSLIRGGQSGNRRQKHKGAKSHLCHQCGRSFSRSDMLTRHSRLHSGLKPYQCGKCLQVFSRSDHLSTHERTHTGEKPYQCEFCAYSACRRDMITRHMRTHSANNSNNSNSSVNRRDPLPLPAKVERKVAPNAEEDDELEHELGIELEDRDKI